MISNIKIFFNYFILKMIGFTSMSKLSDQFQQELKQPTSVDNVSINNSINSTPISTTSNSNNSSRANSSLLSFQNIANSNANINNNEYNLKLLESNFNQIAMAYHSDEQAVENNIEQYQDKYKKASNYMNLLIDEVTLIINKMLNLLINEKIVEIDDNNDDDQNTTTIATKHDICIFIYAYIK